MQGIAALRIGGAPGRWVGNDLWRRARAVPSLDLQFADTKSLADAISGQNLVSFTRASTGTYVGSDGVLRSASVNEPRFDHNPTTGESLGLLVEEQRTNLLLRSEEFDNASWSKTGSSATANSITSPNGLLTADKLVEDTSTGGHVFVQEISGLPDNTTYTASVFCKAAERNWVAVTVVDKLGIINRVWYNVATGVQGTTNGTVSAFSATLFSNGWYRLAVSASTSTGVGAAGVRVSLGTADNTAAYTGNGTSGLYLWGAQLEAGSFPTSYIPTTTAAATRAADVAQITGTNFSSWYRQDEGSIYISGAPRYTYGGTNTFPRTFSISNNTTTTMIDGRNRVLSPFSDSGYAIADGGVTQATYDSARDTAGQAMCIAYKVNSFAFSTGGTLSDSDTSGTVPTVDRITLGSLANGLSVLNGTIRRLTYFPQRLPDSALQAITQP